MNANDYQKQAARTLIKKPKHKISDNDIMIIWCAVGLAGEAGEVMEIIKKGILHEHGIEDAKIKKEIGDCLWYLAGLCTTFGFNMSEIMQENIDKLMLRYPNGYSSEDSMKRVDVK